MVVVVVVTKRVEKPGDKVSRVAWTGQSCGSCCWRCGNLDIPLGMALFISMKNS
jgi:hypothetical protein